MIAIVSALFLSQAPGSQSLMLDGAEYVVAPPEFIARTGDAFKWSRDSRTIIFETGGVNESLPARRKKLRRDGKKILDRTQLVRYDTQTGRIEVLQTILPTDYFGQRQTVGDGGDVLFEVKRPAERRAVFRQLWYAPAGQVARRISDWQAVSNSSAISLGRTALYAYTTDDQLRVFVLSDESVREVSGLEKYRAGTFLGNTSSGGAVLNVDVKSLGGSSEYLQIDYRSLAVLPVDFDVVEYVPAIKSKEPFRLRAYKLPKAGLIDPEVRLFNLELTDKASPPRSLVFARSVRDGYLFSPDGLKLAYETPQGFFLAEVVKKD
jgi:hypothetical protein